MDRKLKKNEQGAKKLEFSYKDRGDVKKERLMKIKADIDIQVSNKKINVQDRGDSPNKIQKTDKLTGKKKDYNDCKVVEIIKSKNRLSHTKNTNFLSEKNLQRIYDKMKMNVKPLDIQKRRRLAEIYTFRRTNDNASTSVLNKDDERPERSVITVKIEQASKRQTYDENKKGKHSHSLFNSLACAEKTVKGNNRKPSIKTVTCNHDSTKVYKAVTFIDKKHDITPLTISIPNNMSSGSQKTKSESPDSLKSNSLSTSLSSTKEKPVISRKSKRKRISSPQLPLKDPPMLTEVAKWVPLSVNQHTKPYYEAWVNTTLAATSKNTDYNVHLKRQAWLDNVKNISETPKLPEPSLEELSDERYTGRIRIKYK